MNVDYCIIPECFTDTNLIETLVPPINRKGYNHQMGCNKVSGKMQTSFKDNFALGIIDKDKRQIKYLDEFELLSEKKHIRLFKHKQKHHYLIQISPAIEGFILDAAKEADLDISNFGFSNELEEFKKITKRQTGKGNPLLSNLFKTILNQKVKEFVLLSKWIEYLREHTYNSDVELLKNL